MAAASKTKAKTAGAPLKTGVSGSELWKLADSAVPDLNRNLA